MAQAFWDLDANEYIYSEVEPDEYEYLTPTSSIEEAQTQYRATLPPSDLMSTVQISLPLPVLPQGWKGENDENDFKAVGQLSPSTQRNLEPVGPHFLAHARRVR